MVEVDLIIEAGMALVGRDLDPVTGAAVAIKNGEIVFAGPSRRCREEFCSRRMIERPGGLLVPGLINAHTHAAMVLFRGMADDLPLRQWLEDYIFPAESRLTRELVALGTELACAEMIRSGTTSFVDMYLFEAAVAEVVDRVGMRAWIGEGVFDFASPAFPSGREALIETRRLWEQWKDHPRITVTVDPHTPYTACEELMREASKLARELSTLLVTHVAETQWEIEEIGRRHSKGPVQYLDSIGVLDSPVLAAHCVWLGHEEIEIFAKKCVSVAHCPESNLKLASGMAPVKEMLSAGVTVTLGTDGAASNNDLDMFCEMDTAAKLPKGRGLDPEAVGSKGALLMATKQAATALMRDDLGEISPGCRADLVVVDMDRPHLQPCYNPVSQLVYCAKGSDVTDVLVEGEFLLEQGRLVTIDEEGLLERVKRKVAELGYGSR